MAASPSDTSMSRPWSGKASPPLNRKPSRSRTQSFSSDRPSTVTHSLMAPPPSVSPEPAFIAASAASQIVTNDHDCHADVWYDQHGVEPSGETAVLSAGALLLVNSFLDQLLFNLLAVSRCTSLAALRPAVVVVLKPKLAKEAIDQADEELREYLGGSDDEETCRAGASSPGDWDPELAWKRSRLRCMVYSSLGDMEEEEEDYHVEREHLETDPDRPSESVSPAVAIFLTSLLEYVGEQALVVAGQAAYHRVRLRYERELKEGKRSPSSVAERVVVEELDTERVALDRTLGRLWRSWKKKLRMPVPIDVALTRAYTKDSLRERHTRLPSLGVESMLATLSEPAEMAHEEGGERPADEAVTKGAKGAVAAAAVPLLSKEEASAGCSDDGDDEMDEEMEVRKPSRIKSLLFLRASRSAELSMATCQLPRPMPTRRSRSCSLPPLTPGRTVEPGPGSSSENATAVRAAAGKGSRSGQAAGASAVHAALCAPQQEQKATTDVEEEEEEVDFEEPQILTSSRVSISGRSISPATSDQGKPVTVKPIMTSSTSSRHSLRLIEVSSPRSPVEKSPVSRALDHRFPTTLSRSRSGSTPPISEESGAAEQGRKNDVGSRVFLAIREAISEVGERADGEVSPVTPTPAPTPSERGPSGIAQEQEQDAQADSCRTSDSGYQQTRASPEAWQPIFGSSARNRRWPAADATGSAAAVGTSKATGNVTSNVATKVTTKVTILPRSTNTFVVEGLELARQSTAPSTPPDRSPSRNNALVASLPSTVQQQQPIGIISVSGGVGGGEQAAPSRRPLHTATSSVSSNKGKAFRTSEDGGYGRNFDELIYSGQTIQYTLTPESMREVRTWHTRTRPSTDTEQALASKVAPVTGSPGVGGRPRGGSRGGRSRSSSLSTQRLHDGLHDAISRSAGLSSHPVVDSITHSITHPSLGHDKVSGSTESSVARIQKARADGTQARDARLRGDPLADLVDFFRSTGPATGAVTGAVAGPVPGPGSESPVPGSAHSATSSNARRIKLEAREATVDYRFNNEDLIDFIRCGPPIPSGRHRIPRSVAPFRTTMDSDQLTFAVGARAMDAQLPDLPDLDPGSSRASTKMTSQSMASVPSSINSQSALLGRKTRQHVRPRAADEEGEVMPTPVRKTRRVRDPYAIDPSDEEAEDDGMMRPQVRPREESLAEFLANGPAPSPMAADSGLTERPKRLRRKGSAPSLMARLTRREPGTASALGIRQAKADSRSLSSRGGGLGRGFLPLRVDMPPPLPERFPAQGNTGTATATSTATATATLPRSGGRVPVKKFQPREAVPEMRGTSDLADFLMNSEPPSGKVATPFGPGPAVESTLSRKFTRRKKASLV